MSCLLLRYATRARNVSVQMPPKQIFAKYLTV